MAGHETAVANLGQNPTRRPICSALVPTLLRQGNMWLLRKGSDDVTSDARSQERMLLPKETRYASVFSFYVSEVSNFPLPVPFTVMLLYSLVVVSAQ